MTLQMLQYFIAVAKYQNFTKAAQSCFVTQPALSRAIQELEEELSCRLLVRTSRSVMLTPEGEVCLEEARRVLRQCDQLAERVREAGRRKKEPLRVGYLIYGHLNTFIEYLASQLPDGLPFVLETEYGSPTEAKKRFIAGELDAILLPEAAMADLEGIEWRYVAKSRAYAIFYKKHRFFERESVTLKELSEEPVIMWSYREQPLLSAAYTAMCREAGFHPQIVGQGEKMGDITALVALHNGIGFATRTTSFIHSQEFHCIPITDSPQRFGLVCVWQKEKQSPQLKGLKRLFTEKGETAGE